MPDATPHHAGPQDADHVDRTGRVRGHADPLASGLSHVEDVDEVLAHGRHQEFGGLPGFGHQALLHALAQELSEEGEDPEGRRIVPARRRHHFSASHREDDAATDARAVHQAGQRLPRRWLGARRCASELDRESACLFVEEIGRQNFGREADLFGLSRVHLLARQEEVERRLQADQAGKARGPAPRRENTELYLRQRHRRLLPVRQKAVIARQRHLDATAHTEAVDGRDRGDGQSREVVEYALAEPDLSLGDAGVLDAADRLDVGPGDEGVTLATAYHQRTQSDLASRVGGLAQELAEPGHDGLGEHVDRSVRGVEGQPPDPVRVDLEGRVFGSGHRRRGSETRGIITIPVRSAKGSRPGVRGHPGGPDSFDPRGVELRGPAGTTRA